MSIATRQLFALTLAAATILVVTGCSADTTVVAKSIAHASAAAEPKAGQTKVQACELLSGKLKPTADALKAALATMATDPDAAVAKLGELSIAVDKAVIEIENPQVKKLGDNLNVSLKSMTRGLTAALADKAHADTAKLTASVTDFEKAGGAVAEACGA